MQILTPLGSSWLSLALEERTQGVCGIELWELGALSVEVDISYVDMIYTYSII